MRRKRRHALLISLVAACFFGCLYLGSLQLERVDKQSDRNPENVDAPSFMDLERDFGSLLDETKPSSSGGVVEESVCSFASCFNISRCTRGRFRVHIYPSNAEMGSGAFASLSPVSEAYAKMLAAVRNSRYYTDEPSEACVFVLAFDTLDRDPLSADFLPNLRLLLNALPPQLWDGGRNHLIFNMYHGTYPNYAIDDISFEPGFAMMARASTAVSSFRAHFDVSLPLFHKQLPLRQIGVEPSSLRLLPAKSRFLLVFKGKRYVYGIGSDTRNSLFHLHNGKDVIMLTTCRHGKVWQRLQDERCADDNDQFERWDYEQLMRDASFCLVPRGRRLGSFRFVESLRAGCVPVVLSDDWLLPLSSVVDWSRAALRVDERQLLQLSDMLRGVPAARVLEMKQQGRLLFERYFSSVERIVFSVLEVIRERVDGGERGGRRRQLWDGGDALRIPPEFSGDVVEYPFHASAAADPSATALVYSGRRSPDSSNVLRLVASLAKSQYCRRVVILWANERPIPSLEPFASADFAIKIVDARSRSPLSVDMADVRTAAVFSIDDRVALNSDEVAFRGQRSVCEQGWEVQIDFALEVWRWMPARLVGYFAESHAWNEQRRVWQSANAAHLGNYTTVSISAAVFHSYYLRAFTWWLPPVTRPLLDDGAECVDVLFNLFVLDVNGLPPVKLSARPPPPSVGDARATRARQACLERAHSLLSGPIHLLASLSRADPLLYKDKVSNLRKKYRLMEH